LAFPYYLFFDSFRIRRQSCWRAKPGLYAAYVWRGAIGGDALLLASGGRRALSPCSVTPLLLLLPLQRLFYRCVRCGVLATCCLRFGDGRSERRRCMDDDRHLPEPLRLFCHLLPLLPHRCTLRRLRRTCCRCCISYSRARPCFCCVTLEVSCHYLPSAAPRRSSLPLPRTASFGGRWFLWFGATVRGATLAASGGHCRDGAAALLPGWLGTDA